MLKQIKIKVQFVNHDGTPGYGTDKTVEFKEGLTAITGPNGKGKSLIQEMIQFAFWGIAALRGVADDYKTLDIELQCWIKGKPYTIVRTISKAYLLSGHGEDCQPLASGTKAVNQAVKELFGYSMSVFQVANAVNQKQVDAFCAMLPTARKKLVDETIGLSALDALVKWIGEHETSIKAQLKARGELLREPECPVLPEGYEKSSKLHDDLVELYLTRRERDLVAMQAAQIVTFPEEVKLEEDDAKLDEYKAQSRRYYDLMLEAHLLVKEIAELGTFPIPKDLKLEKDDENLEEYRDTQMQRSSVLSRKGVLVKQYNLIPESPYNANQLDEFEALLVLRQRFFKKKEMLAKGVGYHCDQCGHDGHMHDPRVESEYGDVPGEEPAPSPLTQEQIVLHRRVLEQQEQKKDLERQILECDEFLRSNQDPTSRVLAIVQARQAFYDNADSLRKQDRFNALTAKRAELNVKLLESPDCSADVVRIENTRTAFYLGQEFTKQAIEKEKKVAEAKAALEAFDPALDNKIALFETMKNQSLVYETHLASYTAAKVTYDAELVKQNELQADLEDWTKGKQAVADLRTKIKGFLLPSLNKVASYLINEFTEGVLPWVVINDDFEVIVAGKRVETLSGGGKTAANLAIRIGLGQVLTNSVFPVLMLDEPDESCDEMRAIAIEKTLKVLREKMKQIILVTHKTGAVADYHIRLGE